jgi:disulfide bond formation protein DsbB
MTRSLAVALNALGLYAIALVLAAAFAAQLLLGELPCPLCLLQRIQFALLAIGPILNVRFGPRPSHYAASLLVAAAGAAFAMRQILLHIMPGDPGYGSALLGYHYYTWAFIGFAVAIVATAIMLLFDRQFEDDGGTPAGRGQRVCAYRGVAGDRTHCRECDFNLARMRVGRLPRRSGRLRAAQGHALEFVDKDIQGPADATTGRSLRRCRRRPTSARRIARREYGRRDTPLPSCRQHVKLHAGRRWRRCHDRVRKQCAPCDRPHMARPHHGRQSR